MRIGLFDSGVGGLTVLKSFLKYHPNNEYFYYGDTKNVPYGDKSLDELYNYIKNIITYLKEKKVDIIVIACGTVSTNLYDRLKNEVDVPIYSIVSQIPNYIKENKYKKTLVLATNKTVNSHIFKKSIDTEVIEVACPKLVPIIENEEYDKIDEVLDEYIKGNDYDSVVLGCTHYPIIIDYIRKKVGNNVDIIDMGEILARNIEISDSMKSINLFFSKKTPFTEKSVNNLIYNEKN